MDYKLLALDIDGTLLNHERQISPRVRQAVQAARAAGCLVTLATGRRHRSASKIAEDLGLDVPLIMYSGSLVYDCATRNALYHHPLPPAFIRQAVSFIRQAGYKPVVLQSPLGGERIFTGPVEDDNQYLRDYIALPGRGDAMERCSYEELAYVAEALTVVAVGPYAGHPILYAATGEFPCHVFHYTLTGVELEGLHGFDFIQPGVSKAVALEKLAGHYGLSLEQTIAIGDNFNDLDMLQAAGLGVAMGNASAEVKAHAGAVVASNREDGVADAIERFILR